MKISRNRSLFVLALLALAAMAPAHAARRTTTTSPPPTTGTNDKPVFSPL